MKNPPLSLPDPGFKALIFDLDGTVVDSMPAHFQSWALALADHGAAGVFSEEVFYAMGGQPTRDIVQALNEAHGLSLDPEEVEVSKKHHFLSCLDQVRLVDSVVEFARANHGEVPMAIATGGGRVEVEETLSSFGLSALFDAVVTANDVEKGKPAPDIFLEAASRLGVEPSGCVVFEDAPAGIKGARAAGMEVVIVPTHLNLA